MKPSERPAISKTFLRVSTIAAMLDVSKGHIWNMVKDPSFNFPKPIKLSPQITVFEAAAVEAWTTEHLAANTKKAA